MMWHRNVFQMKEQENTQEELRKVKLSNLHNKEIKRVIIKVLK